MITPLVLAMQASVSVQTSPAPANVEAAEVLSFQPETFRAMGAATALDIVLRVPGFTYDRGAVVRGLAGAAGNVLVDGQRPVSKSDTLDDILRRIATADVRVVQLIRGNASGLDTQGRALVVNIVRNQQSGFNGLVSGSETVVYDGRVNPTLRVEGRWTRGGREFEAALASGRGADEGLGDGERIRTAADGRLLLKSDVDADGDAVRSAATVGYKGPLFDGALRLNGAYISTPYDFEITERLEGGGREYEYSTSHPRQLEVSSRFSRQWAGGAMSALAFQQWEDRRRRSHFEALGLSRDFHANSDTSETIGRLEVRQEPAAAWILDWGAEGAVNRLNSRSDLFVNGNEVHIPAANVRVEEIRYEAFATLTWKPSDAWTLEAGIRQEGSQISASGDVDLENTFRFTKPRLLATGRLRPTTELRVRVEREVGQLNFNDFVASPAGLGVGVVLAGNPDLAPQQAWVAEFALEQRFWERGVVTLAYRYFALTDVIDRVPLFGPTGIVADAAGNIGEGARQEYQASLSTPLTALGLRAGQIKAAVTYRTSSVTDPLTGRSREISALRPVEWEVRYSHDQAWWRGSWGFEATGGFRERLFRLSEVQTTKNDTWLTLYADIRIDPLTNLRLEVQNSTSRGVQRTREVYAGPRSSTPIIYTDVRDLDFGPLLFIRLRRTLK